MVNSKFLKRIMVVGEKSIMQQLTSFVDMATTAADLLSQMLIIEENEKIEINEKIKLIEKNADDVSIDLRQQITGGAISSNLMDNLLTLVETCDDLLDKSYFLSREIKRIHENTHKFDEDSKAVLNKGYSVCREILKIEVVALKDVKTLLESKDAKVMTEARERVENMEEHVDELKDGLIDELYGVTDHLPYIIFIHLTELVHKLDDLLDDCEDISELVHTIDLSITR